MSAISVLRERLLQARKDRNEVQKNFFSYMIGIVTKTDKEPSDETVFAALRAYKNQISEQPLSGSAKEVADQEIALVGELLPYQMTDHEIEKVIAGIKNSGIDISKNFGEVMKVFKTNYVGKFAPGNVRAVWERLK